MTDQQFSKPEPLTGAQRWLAAATGLVCTGLAVLGGVGSFQAVADVAAAHGFAHPGRVPLGADLGIVALFLADLLLAWLGMPFPPLRWMAHTLVGATIWFNVAASWGDPIGMAMHAVAPVLIIAWVEGVRHAVQVRASMAKRRHIETAQFGRWLLAPIATARLWRRQQLWRVTDYDEALALERRRLLAIAHLRKEHGLAWRWKKELILERVALRVRPEPESSPPASPPPPDPAAARVPRAAGAERATGGGGSSRPERRTRVGLRGPVETEFLTREIGKGEELVGAELARQIDGDGKRSRRVQELLNELRHNPTDEQRARIAAAREAAGRPASTQGPTLTAVPAIGEQR